MSLRSLGAALACCATVALLANAPAAAAARPPRLTARAAILIDEQTGQALYAYHANRELPIASTTKLMTALVTLQREHHLGKLFTAPNYYAAPADSQIGLVPGERMSVHDLLLAMMLPSADDAAEDLAYNVGHGSVARFVAMMNAEARALGLHHTHYSTPIGLDTPGNYSTAADLVKLATYDLTHSAFFRRIVARPRAVLRTGSHVRYIVNLNDLVSKFPWIDGVKTGHTAAAGYVLVASGHRHGMSLLSAVLGTSSEAARDANSLALLDYGFANFHRAQPIAAGQVLARPTVRYRPREHAALVAPASIERVIGDQTHLTVDVHAPRRLAGPLRRGTRLGTAVVLADGRPVARMALLLASALPAVSPSAATTGFMTRAVLLVPIVLVGLGPLAFLARRRRRARAAMGGVESA